VVCRQIQCLVIGWCWMLHTELRWFQEEAPTGALSLILKRLGDVNGIPARAEGREKRTFRLSAKTLSEKSHILRQALAQGASLLPLLCKICKLKIMVGTISGPQRVTILMKYQHATFVWQAGVIIFALFMVSAPIACQLMPCCLPTSECCDDCADDSPAQNGAPLSNECSTGHCLSGVITVAPEIVNTVTCVLISIRTQNNQNEFIPDLCSEPIYRPPITA
jgi:hypothetical protein